jgi:hypothetical protein
VHTLFALDISNARPSSSTPVYAQLPAVHPAPQPHRRSTADMSSLTPPTCSLCGQALPSQTGRLRHVPRADISSTTPPTCPLCGQPPPSPLQSLPRAPQEDLSSTIPSTCPLCGQPLAAPSQRRPRVLRIVLRVSSVSGPGRHPTLLISTLVMIAIDTSDTSFATPAA